MPGRNKKKNNNNHRGRGRGRGGPNGVPTTVVPATASAGRPPRHPYPNPNAEFDVGIQQWAEPPDAGGSGHVNGGRGPWRGGTPKSRSGAGTPLRGSDTPRRGNSTPRGMGAERGRGGRGRGQGRGRDLDNGGDPFSARRRPHFGGVGVGSKGRTTIGKDVPLSDLLYSTRPLLRPVKFVRATLTPFLFQESEEMLIPASTSQAADTTETSHVPTADRVARLFYDNASDSDSESQGDAQDALEEIDFADLAQVRAEIDAIAQDTVAMDQDVYDDQEEIEEVDFADLAVMRAKVDAAGPQAASRDDIIQEVFTGVYNQVKDTMQVSSTMGVVGDNQPHGVQQTASSSVLSTLDDSLDPKPSIDISNPSHHESFSHARDTIVVEEEVPCSSNASPNVSVEEPSLSTALETHPASVPTGDIPLYPYAPPHDDSHLFFVVDTAPTYPLPGRSSSDIILVDRTGHSETLGDQDEERIVYVAPHPRSGRASPIPVIPRVKLPRTSILTGRSLETGRLRSPVREDDGGPMPAGDRDRTRTTHAGVEDEAGENLQLSLASLSLGPTTSTLTSTSSSAHPSPTKAGRRARKKEARLQRQNKQSQMGFRAYGAMMSEARLREEDVKEKQHPRWETRRRGDSDVDWGTGDEYGEGEVDAVSDDLGGMEIDPDLEMDVNAMRGFLKSMSAKGSQFVTMDDIEDEAQMQLEDEEGEGGPEGSSASERSDDDEVEGEAETDQEEEEVFNIEEEILIAESEGDEELSEDSDDDDNDDELSPGSSFQARLRKVRERSRGQHPETVREISDDEDDEDIHQALPFTRGADDEDYLAHISELIEENSHILSGRDRKEKNAVFRNLHQGVVHERDVDDPEFTTPVNKKKNKGKGKQFTGDFAAELEAQRVKDRAKKAEQKRQRQTARFLAALDPLSADATKGNNGRTRASHKAMSAVARLDPSKVLAIAPGAIVDMNSLEAQMRRFVENVGERRTMALPPMDKGMRKSVHEMARLFGLNSVSKGDGEGRYTTLIKTRQTGVGVNEKKVRAVMKRYGGAKFGRGRGGGGGMAPRHREGDEVGKEAPKIGERNIGFRMLASMGWSEGDRIGGTASVGIEAPLTAIIKNSKLGLGATREK